MRHGRVFSLMALMETNNERHVPIWLLSVSLDKSHSKQQFFGQSTTPSHHYVITFQNKIIPHLFINVHCVKSVPFRSYSGPYFPLGLNTERYGVSVCIQSECGKIWARITPNTDTFYAVVTCKPYQLKYFNFLKILHLKL